MIAIDNSGLANLGLPLVDVSLVSPAVTYSANFSAKTITFTDASVFASPDSFGHINVSVTDGKGNSVYGAISAAAGNTGAIDLSGLSATGTLAFSVCLTSARGVIATGSNYAVSAAAATGAAGNWSKYFTTSAH